MGLAIYETNDENTAFSLNGANTAPIRFSADGRTGRVIEKLYYVRNDNNLKSYTSISLSFSPNIANDVVNGEDGFSMKLKAGSTQPSSQEWDLLDHGNTITISNIVDTQTYSPFWIRMVIPAGAPVQTVSNMSVRITATENVI